MPTLPAKHSAMPVGVKRFAPAEDEPVRLRGRTLQTRNARILTRDPLCKICLAKTPSIVSQSVEVDHVMPLHLGGSDSDDNVAGICRDCHHEKTAKEATARAKGTAVVVKQPPRPRNYSIA